MGGWPLSQEGLPPEAVDHYSSAVERDRLGPSSLERLRTQELLERFLPKPPARVLDVGGGAGVYAAWLAELGYDVHLLDAVPHHVEQAREAAGKPPAFTAEQGDARSLEEGDGSQDAVLLLGPLYHLTERTDRMTALREARRVLRAGGVLAAAAICRTASLLDGLAQRRFHDPRFQAIVAEDLRSGQHRNPTENPEWFTTAFFHAPDELRDEVYDAGFESCQVFGVEGPGSVLPGVGAAGVPDGELETLLLAARWAEQDPLLVPMSSHLLALSQA